jgi:hypothetical protein
MSPEGTVRAYYDTLRAGDPLHPFFHESPTTVKFGVGETLSGYEAVAAGLREQTATTADWTVASDALVVGSEGDSAWFADRVHMAWTDTEAGVEHEYDTRWSGSMVREDGEWPFTGMHVSVPARAGEGDR